MRSVAIGFVLLVLAAGAWFYFEMQDSGGPMPNIQVSEPTNFNEVGTITVNNPGQAQGEMYLVYEKPGAPALTKRLVLDELSVCAAPNGAVPCMAMSVTFDAAFGGKRALVEGSEAGETVLVRKLRVGMEGEELRSFDPGNVFISWPHAIELFKACQVAMATQTHSLDVYLDLKDGRKVRAVEPMIDEMFTIINQTQSACGAFPVATE
jgi:hypothetical protein